MKEFIWNSLGWWDWLRAHKRCPSAEMVTHHLLNYETFVVFHGCRPVDVQSYYDEGLKISDLDRLNQIAREVFLTSSFPVITESALTEAIEQMDGDPGKLFVVLDDRDLLQHCGHYMIYGSEHLCGIGANLSHRYGIDCRQLLKRRGRPTLLRIRLPRESIPPDEIDSLALELCDVWTESRRDAKPPQKDYCFSLDSSIDSRWILDHSHPDVIPDPLLGDIPYRFEK